MKNGRMSGHIPQLEANFKKDRYSFKKFLDRSRFSPRLLLFTRLSKSVDGDSTKPANIDTDPKLSSNHSVAPVSCLCSHGSQEHNLVSAICSTPAAILSSCPLSNYETTVAPGLESGPNSEPVVEEEYEESLSHFSDVILENLRSVHNCNIKHSPDGISQVSSIERGSAYCTLPTACLANCGCPATASNSEPAQAVCFGSPQRNSFASSEPINPCAIYNEPCDAKPLVDDIVDGPPMIYTMSNLTQELNEFCIEFGGSSKNSTKSSSSNAAVSATQSLQPLALEDKTHPINTACDSHEFAKASGGVSRLSPSNDLASSAVSSTVSIELQPSHGFVDSPRGNSVIVHHPTSPFARVPRIPTDAAPPNHNHIPPSHTEPAAATSSSENMDTHCPSIMNNDVSGGAQRATNDVPLKRDSSSTRSSSKHACKVNQPRSDTQATYEEAWDLKMARQLGFGIPRLTATPHTLAKNKVTSCRAPELLPTRLPVDVLPERLALRASPANSQPTSGHDLETNDITQNGATRTSGISAFNIADGMVKSGLLSHENRLFDERPIKKPTVCLKQPQLSVPSASEYDYAYNGSWCMGVKLNLSLAMNSVSKSEPTHFPDVTHSVAEHRLLPPAVPAHQPDVLRAEMKNLPIHQKVLSSPLDLDAISTDSCDDSWDKKHGQAMSELTNSRFMNSTVIPPVPSPPSDLVNPPHVQRVGTHINHVANGTIPNVVSETRCTSRSGLLGNPSALPSRLEILPLEEQLWYHPSLTRSEAEALLSCEPEGSFLVRNSETCMNDYSLTIKHKTFLHMKISRNQSGQFILGEYSQPYSSVPQMIYHYSRTLVPVRGADCVTLTHPVCRRIA